LTDRLVIKDKKKHFN